MGPAVKPVTIIPSTTPSQISGSNNNPQPKSTWSEVLSDKASQIKTFNPHIETEHGTATVVLPSEVIRDSTPLWKDFIVGHFIGDPPHIGKVHAIVNKLWIGTNKRVDVQFKSKSVVLFRIDGEVMCTRILKKHYWHIADIPLVKHEWKPKTLLQAPDLSLIPLWVDFGSVPGNLYSYVGLSYIGRIIGKPIKLNQNTECCVRLDVARILIEVNLEKPLPSTICLRGNDGKNINISVTFPKLPIRCSVCKKWGHGDQDCQTLKQVPTAEVETTTCILHVRKNDPDVEEKCVVPLCIYHMEVGADYVISKSYG